MTEATTIDQILKAQRLGFAVFDREHTLLDSNFKYSDFRQASDLARGKVGLWQVFPELIGYEQTIAELLAGARKPLVLEKLNQLDRTDRLQYYNLRVLALAGGTRSPARLLCLAEDVTEQTALEQEARQQRYEVQLLQSQLLNQSQFLSGALLGQSAKIQAVREFVGKVAQYNTSVLLQGESGTGKSLVARLIHRARHEGARPFVEINCAAIPETLLESELFGHEKGAFTNALASKKGLLEEADNGTLFLDEIGELPLSLQAKLLTFLETRRFRRVGSTREQSVDVRVVVATNKDLKKAIAAGEFREDLYYRINVVALTLPPIRELDDDIIQLAEHFISILQIDMKKAVHGLTAEAKRKLLSHSWPGNVRELRNIIERAMIFTTEPRITAAELWLPDTGVQDDQASDALHIPAGGLSLEELEKKYLIASLRQTGGNQSRSAELLAMSLDTFRYRLKKHGISIQAIH